MSRDIEGLLCRTSGFDPATSIIGLSRDTKGILCRRLWFRSYAMQCAINVDGGINAWGQLMGRAWLKPVADWARWGRGEGTLEERTKFQSLEKAASISLCMWNHKGDFVFVCQKSNPISIENTKPGVTVIWLANKYHCPFLLAKLTMKDTLLECKINAIISFSSITKDYSLLKDF